MSAAETILHALVEGPKLTRQLAALADISTEHARSVCRCLHKRGVIFSVEGAHGITPKGLDALEKNNVPCRKGRAASSRGRTLRQKVWSAMRMLSTFDVQRLMSLVCDGHEAQAENNITNYCRALHRAGYLRKTPRTGSYYMTTDSGPLSPAYNRVEKTVTDRNTGEVHHV